MIKTHRQNTHQKVQGEEEVLVPSNHSVKYSKTTSQSNVEEDPNIEGVCKEQWVNSSKQSTPVQGNTPTIAKIEMCDVNKQIEYWSSALICYVLGANPPFNVINGFFNQIWKNMGIEKVVVIGKGIFIVIFKTIDQLNLVLNGVPQFFDFKLLIKKAWDSDILILKEDVRTVLVWIKLPRLDIKYQGVSCLEKIVGGVEFLLIWELMMPFLIAYALKMKRVYIVKQVVEYEWKPVMYTNCKLFGHTQELCKNKKKSIGGKQAWIQKEGQDHAAPTKPVETMIATVTETVEVVPVHNRGFQVVKSKLKSSSQLVKTPPSQERGTYNTFEILTPGESLGKPEIYCSTC
ncbi:polyprotein [Bienertia sinuspersici]